MIALREQHLHQGAAQVVHFVAGAFHLHARLGRQGAGCGGATAHLDRAELATAVGLELRVIAEMGDVAPRAQGRLDQGLAGVKGISSPSNKKLFTSLIPGSPG